MARFQEKRAEISVPVFWLFHEYFCQEGANDVSNRA